MGKNTGARKAAKQKIRGCFKPTARFVRTDFQGFRLSDGGLNLAIKVEPSFFGEIAPKQARLRLLGYGEVRPTHHLLDYVQRILRRRIKVGRLYLKIN